MASESTDFDASALHNLSGLSRLQTDPMQSPDSNINTNEEESDIAMLPSIGGLSRLQTDPAAFAQLEYTTDAKSNAENDAYDADESSSALPSLRAISRLPTDLILQELPDPDPQTDELADNENVDDALNSVEYKSVLRCMTDKVSLCLQSGMDTDFVNWNIWDLCAINIASNFTMAICANHIFERLQLFDSLQIDRAQFLSFVSCIERGYMNVPYHSAVHGADVMINAYHMLIASQLVVSDIDKLCVLIAALCHDYKHPGLNDDFLIKSKHALAHKYQAQSPILETMHFDETMLVLKLKRFNFLSHLERAKMSYIEASIRRMILGTDMKLHAQHMAQLETLLQSKQQNKEARVEVMVIGVHAADIASICKSWKIFETWALKIFQEFWMQGDQEKEQGLQVTPSMKREDGKEQIMQHHSQFITKMMLPFYEKWAAVFADKQQFQQWCKQLIANNEKLLANGIDIPE